MGYIKHHTIVVTCSESDKLKIAHKKAMQIFAKSIDTILVGDIMQGLTNGQNSFFIAPDGSKEGWEISNKADDARKEFLDWLNTYDSDCDYVEVIFGGDDDHERIVRSRYRDSLFYNN